MLEGILWDQMLFFNSNSILESFKYILQMSEWAPYEKGEELLTKSIF